VFNVGPMEIVLVLVIALIVLGPQRLPDVARSVGKGMREFRGALASVGDDDDDDEPDRRRREADEPEAESDEPEAASHEPDGEPDEPPAERLPEGS
jgi:sec-independent protein translocase protein TatA